MVYGVQDPHDLTVLLILCILNTAHLVWLARHPQTWRLACRRTVERFVRCVKGAARASWDAVTWKPRNAAPDDPLFKEVKKLVAERCVLLAIRMYSVADKCFQVLGAARLLNIATATPSFISPGADVVFLIVYSLLMVQRVCPRVVRKRTLDWWYSFWMLLAVLQITPLGIYKEALPLLSGFNLMFRLVAGFLTTNLPLVICWNVVYVLAVGASYSLMESECTMLPYASTLIVAETVTCCYLCLFFNGLRAAQHSQARQELEARDAKDENSALTAILNTMSDAVVELDEELRIVGGSDKLASMLLRGHVHGLQGMPFVHFSATEEDSRRFEDHFLHQPVEVQQSQAGVLHMRIRDSLSNSIGVEIFHVCKTHQDRCHRLVGIREFTDSERPGGIRSGGGMAPGGIRSGGGIAPELQALDENSSFSTDQENASLDGGLDQGAVVRVVFEAFTFELSDMSSTFIELCSARPSNNKFDKWVVRKDGSNGARLLQMLGRNTNELVHGTDPDDCVTAVDEVRFQVPISASAVTEFVASCSISIRLDASVEDNIIATATLTGIKGKKVRTKKRIRSLRNLKAGGSPHNNSSVKDAPDASSSKAPANAPGCAMLQL